MASQSLGVPQATLAAIQQSVRISGLYTTSSFAILLYDTVSTFPSEYKSVWRASNNSAKWAFLYTRYIGLAFLLLTTICVNTSFSHSRCKVLVYFEELVGGTLLTSQHVLFALRTAAIWQWDKVIVAGLALLILVETIVFIVFGVTGSNPLALPPQIIPQICVNHYKDNTPQTIMTFALPLLIDTIIFGLTCWKLLPTYLRSSKTSFAHGNSSLGPLILKDGLLYYVILIAVGTLNFVWVVGKIGQNHILHGSFFVAITVIMTSRLFLHLKMFNSNPAPQMSASSLAQWNLQPTKTHMSSNEAGQIRAKPPLDLGVPEIQLDMLGAHSLEERSSEKLKTSLGVV